MATSEKEQRALFRRNTPTGFGGGGENGSFVAFNVLPSAAIINKRWHIITFSMTGGEKLFRTVNLSNFEIIEKCSRFFSYRLRKFQLFQKFCPKSPHLKPFPSKSAQKVTLSNGEMT